MPERFRGELLTTGRYTSPASFTFNNNNSNIPVSNTTVTMTLVAAIHALIDTAI